MCFTINPKNRSVRIDACDRIVKIVDFFFIKADRKHDSKFFCQTHSHLYCFVFFCRFCIMIKIIPSLLTEIFPFKKFRQQNNICSFCCRFSDFLFCFFQIFLQLCAALHLDRRCFYFSHSFSAFPCGICCVIQWMFPPPVRISPAYTGRISLCGHMLCKISAAR